MVLIRLIATSIATRVVLLDYSKLLIFFMNYVLAPDPCSLNPCDSNAECQQIGVTSDFSCTCRPPYTGNGTICTSMYSQNDHSSDHPQRYNYFAVPANPCLPTPCDPNAECIRESSLIMSLRGGLDMGVAVSLTVFPLLPH